jgi:polygalacturonase
MLPLSFRAAGMFACALALIPAAHAQDRRQVSEPVDAPTVCSLVAADPGAGADAHQTQHQLQQALDHCPSGQAVRVQAPDAPRRITSAPLRIPSGVTLWLDTGVTLAASTDPRDYDRGGGQCGRIDAKGHACRAFISFDHAHDSGLRGPGSIDGQGGQPMAGTHTSWWQLAEQARNSGKQNAPHLIDIDDSRDITLYRLQLRDSPNFHVAMHRVRGITVWGVDIRAPANARNTDGIDPGNAEDVTIVHSLISTGDDNVAIKAGHDGPSRYISILDNHFLAGHGMSIGSETNGGVSDILVKRLSLDGTTAGLRIKSDASRGGLVQDVRYSDICLRNNRRPIELQTRYDAHATGSDIPVYRNIVFEHVYGQDGDLVMQGFDASHPLDVHLDDVHFAPSARWQVDATRISSGAQGVSPPLDGAPAVQNTHGDPCQERWATGSAATQAVAILAK